MAALVVLVVTIVHSNIIDGPGGICRTSINENYTPHPIRNMVLTDKVRTCHHLGGTIAGTTRRRICGALQKMFRLKFADGATPR